MSKHTEGPLATDAYGNVQDETGASIATVTNWDMRHDRLSGECEANARRIVACWNACEGLRTESLERMPGTFAQAMIHNNFLELWSEYADAKAQRDELLNALRDALQGLQREYVNLAMTYEGTPYENDRAFMEIKERYENARAAIAKATGSEE